MPQLDAAASAEVCGCSRACAAAKYAAALPQPSVRLAAVARTIGTTEEGSMRTGRQRPAPNDAPLGRCAGAMLVAVQAVRAPCASACGTIS
jgi:hypothetical protein